MVGRVILSAVVLAAVLAVIYFLAGSPMTHAPEPDAPTTPAVSKTVSNQEESAAVAGRTATLSLRVTDPASGENTPARIEILDARGESIIPAGALPLFGDCSVSKVRPRSVPEGAIAMPVSGTLQFYLTAPLEIPLAPGSYRITVQKGIEYERKTFDIEIATDEKRALDVELSRWADMKSSGWFSSDAHLHLTRTGETDDALLDWMAAEDLNVANLLQMGSHAGVEASPQATFGLQSVVQRDNTIVASGQENPRTWILGHGIVLGADSYVDDLPHYLAYQDFWEQAREEGALIGYAHFFAPGLWLDVPTGAIDFLEVMQFGISQPMGLYDLLNLGVRITPVAGTDFPCYPAGPPGAERFYARLDGPLTYENWLEAVRAGRTFVTNGPLLEFSVDAVGVGGDLHLSEPGFVTVRATVRFDPARDEIANVELLRAGEVIYSEQEQTAYGLVRLELEIFVDQTTWFALRVGGSKAEATDGLLSAAHSGAVFVEVAGTPPLAEQGAARGAARRGLASLDKLSRRFGENAFRAKGSVLAERISGITAEIGRRDRKKVLEAIERARPFYQRRNRP